MLKLLFVAVLLYIGYRIFIQPKSLEGGSGTNIDSGELSDLSEEEDFVDYEEIE